MADAPDAGAAVVDFALVGALVTLLFTGLVQAHPRAARARDADRLRRRGCALRRPRGPVAGRCGGPDPFARVGRA
nr:hypothetical protein [Angustibacter aerolatus]